MDDVYTPATDDIREAWVASRATGDSDGLPCSKTGEGLARTEFDRWLASHDAEVDRLRAQVATRPAPVVSGEAVEALLTILRDPDNEFHQDVWDALPWALHPSLRATLGITVADASEAGEPPFWRDLVTGETCPRSGPVLCTITDLDHLHRAIHMDAPEAGEQPGYTCPRRTPHDAHPYPARLGTIECQGRPAPVVPDSAPGVTEVAVAGRRGGKTDALVKAAADECERRGLPVEIVAAPTVDAESVEKGARALYDVDGDGVEPIDNIGWRREMEPVRAEYRRKVRAVLTATLGITVTDGGA